MKWSKIVLLFQAVITLILGIIFLAQVLSLSIAGVSELKAEMTTNLGPGEPETQVIDIKQRYASAAYILLFISSMELIIITKLFL